jgi:hypothetical protein
MNALVTGIASGLVVALVLVGPRAAAGSCGEAKEIYTGPSAADLGAVLGGELADDDGSDPQPGTAADDTPSDPTSEHGKLAALAGNGKPSASHSSAASEMHKRKRRALTANQLKIFLLAKDSVTCRL